MGVVNVTPDSFSDGGDNLDPRLRPRRRGGCSPRAPPSSTSAESRRGPGAEGVTADEELRRVEPVLSGSGGMPVSIDTSKVAVAGRPSSSGRCS